VETGEARRIQSGPPAGNWSHPSAKLEAQVKYRRTRSAAISGDAVFPDYSCNLWGIVHAIYRGSGDPWIWDDRKFLTILLSSGADFFKCSLVDRSTFVERLLFT
jgi:hypothetical protein